MSSTTTPVQPPRTERSASTPADRSRTAALVVLLIMALAVLAGFLAARPPAPVPASAPAERFSAARADAHLREITRAPHPVGTEEHARVREYLVAELRRLGLETQVQEATAVAGEAWGSRAATVRNVLARVPGSASTGAVLLMAHYDAVPGSYGAGDDATGVTAILETLRALKAGPPLRNDLLVLFSDAEEVGLLGAHAFHDEHPWARGVSLVLNFEGRGHTGPVLMFETSRGNGALVREAAAALRHPSGNSLMADVYRRLPNDTDVSVFLRSERPYHALNFGFIGGHTHYHTPLDRADELNPATLQHHGEYALALARRFGGADLRRLDAPDRVYFDLPLAGFVHYPFAWALPLAALGVLGLATALAFAVRRRALTAKGAAMGLAALLLSVALAAGIATFGWRAVLAIHPGYRWILQGDTYNAAWYFAAFAALVTAATLAVYALLGRRASAADLAVAPLVAWTALALFTALSLPGGSYLFVWPLLLALAAFALSAASNGTSVRRAAALALLAVPALLVFPPLLRALEVGLTLNALAAPMVVLALLLALLAPQLAVVARPWRWAPAAALLGAGVIALIGGAATSGFSEEDKKPNSVAYLLDSDSNQAYWFSLDPAPDAWTGQFLGERPERGSLAQLGVAGAGDALRASAPAVAIPAPTVTVVADTPVAAGRRLTLRVASPQGAQRTSVFLLDRLQAADVEVNGRRMDDAPPGRLHPVAGGRLLTYYAAPPEGFELRFTVQPADSVPLRVTESRYGLPALPGASVRPRPEWMMSKPFITTDMTVVTRKIRL